MITGNAPRRKRMKGLEPSTFAMARRRSSQLSYIRRSPSIAEPAHGTITSARPSPALRRRYSMRAIDDILERLDLDHSAHGRRSGRAHADHRRAARPRPAAATPPAPTPPSRARRTPSRAGGTSRRRAAASSCGCSARSCGARRRRSARSSRSRRARSPQEGLGEVQEMIDICDLAVGSPPALRAHDRVRAPLGIACWETWHPLGPVAAVTAFNSPGRRVPSLETPRSRAVRRSRGLEKPSERHAATALACQSLFLRAAAAFGDAPEGLRRS